MTEFNRLKADIRDELMENVDVKRELSDEEVLNIIDELIIIKSKKQYISLRNKKRIRREIFNSIRRLDILQELIDDETITEIMINGPDLIFIEQKGKISLWDKQFESREKLEDVIQQMVSKTNRLVNESNPIVDTRLMDGSRVNIVLAPIAINGPSMTIRKFPSKPIVIEDLLEYGSITLEAAEFLKDLVIAGYNIFVSGGTGSGKTTFLNVLTNYIPEDERIITIEDSAELQITQIPNLVRLETRNANVEGNNKITIRDLIKSALRMRPSRIIVGEVRGEECIDMLAAFNTGHDGSLSTGHGNTVHDMLSRLETMVLMGQEMPLEAIRKQISAAVDIIIQLGRLRDKSRRVLEIAEVIGYRDGEIKLSSLFSFIDKGESSGKVIGQLERTGNPLIHTDKLKKAGINLKYE